MIKRNFSKDQLLSASRTKKPFCRDYSIFHVTNNIENYFKIYEYPYPMESEAEPLYIYTMKITFIEGNLNIDPVGIKNHNGTKLDFTYEILDDNIHIEFHKENELTLVFAKSTVLEKMLKITPEDTIQDINTGTVYKKSETGVKCIILYKLIPDNPNRIYIELSFIPIIHPNTYTYNINCESVSIIYEDIDKNIINSKSMSFEFDDDGDGSFSIELNMEGV